MAMTPIQAAMQRTGFTPPTSGQQPMSTAGIPQGLPDGWTQDANGVMSGPPSTGTPPTLDYNNPIAQKNMQDMLRAQQTGDWSGFAFTNGQPSPQVMNQITGGVPIPQGYVPTWGMTDAGGGWGYGPPGSGQAPPPWAGAPPPPPQTPQTTVGSVLGGAQQSPQVMPGSVGGPTQPVGAPAALPAAPQSNGAFDPMAAWQQLQDYYGKSGETPPWMSMTSQTGSIGGGGIGGGSLGSNTGASTIGALSGFGGGGSKSSVMPQIQGQLGGLGRV